MVVDIGTHNNPQQPTTTHNNPQQPQSKVTEKRWQLLQMLLPFSCSAFTQISNLTFGRE
jgi:hypothetical protein